MKPLDFEFIRAQFPAFSHPTTAPWIMCENAGGSYAAGHVVAKLNHFMTGTKVQPYWEFAPSAEAGRAMDRSHELFAAALNAERDEVMFGPSTSINTYVLSHALRPELSAGDEIIVTNQDHEANGGAWRRLADGNTGIVVREWSVDKDSGRLDPKGLDRLLNGRTKLVCVTHCSNIIGEINDIGAIARKVHAAGARIAVDGVSYAPHRLADMKALGADFYYFSLYKVYGPHQGLMYVRRDSLERIANQGHFFNEGYLGKRLTPAGPQHGEIACASGVIDYLEDCYRHHLADPAAPAGELHQRVGAVMDHFHDHESIQADRVLALLNDKGARVLGLTSAKTGNRAATIGFRPKKGTPQAIATALVARHISCGSGHFYAHRVIEACGIDPEEGVCRLSLVHYNSSTDVDRLLTALDEVL